MYKILIVEDELTIASTLANHFKKWDYETKYITDFKDILTQFVQYDPQLVLLDIKLPFFNGYHWCSEIRKVSNVPIIFLSSAYDNMNIIMAMNMGGDDFVEKPFDLNVLSAKVQASLRRAFSFNGSSNILEHKGVLLNLKSTSLNYNDQTLDLTKNEFKILQILFENAGNVVSRDDIMIKLWENESFIDDNTLTVNMTRLRKKMEGIGLADYIITKKGLGYMVK